MAENNMRSAWNEISKSYQERYKIGISKMHWGPLCPDEDSLQLLGDVSGKKIIEIGGGAGQNSMVLARKQAISTIFDISDKQLSHGVALANEEGLAVKFAQGDFEKIGNYFQPNTFDIGFSVYALQYCKTNASMEETFNQIYGILKEGAVFAFSLDHPVRTIGYWDKKSDRFILDNYFDRSEKEWNYEFPETGTSARMVGAFRTISDIVNAVINAGFTLEKLLEPEPIKYDINTNFGKTSKYGLENKRDPYSFNHLSRIPGTLIIKTRK